MKIIQSYSQFDEGSPYLGNTDKDRNKIYLNFYTFLLSCLTLQKHYGEVTMYCNQKAYDSFIKYIPYSKVIIFENSNPFELWNLYKVDVIKKMTEKFIHVDSDVFVFDKVFSPFIDSDIYDVIIQDTLMPEQNFIRNFAPVNKKVLAENGIFDVSKYDEKCVSCGTIGMTIEVRDKYVNLVGKMKKLYETGVLINVHPSAMIIEELMFHFLIEKNSLSKFEVLPSDLIKIHGIHKVGNIKKYTHMWIDTKFKTEYIKLVKNKIQNEFPEYGQLVHEYDTNVMEKFKILT